MELDELKTSWNALDKRLAETEIVNLRVVKEMIQQKTKSAYNGIVGQNLYSLAVTLLVAAVVFPFIYKNTSISFTSFVIVEAVLLIGLIPQIWKLLLLSRFDLDGKKTNELDSLVLRYKKFCSNESLWTIVCVALAMVAFYLLVRTGSRSGLVACVIGAAVLLLPHVRRMFTWKKIAIAVAALAVAVGVMAATGTG